jgi:ligand-binding sensor domain-containing protein
MKILSCFLSALLFLLVSSNTAFSQDIFFNKVQPPDGRSFRHVTGMVQDRQGYMWFASKKGLFRYDGYQMVTFKHDPLDSSSLATNALEAITIDPNGIIWIATYEGAGLERFDPNTGRFTHYRNNPRDPASLGANWVSAVFVDKEGTLWVGTSNGLDRFDAKTGKFIHYRYQPNDPYSLSSNTVVSIYEDRQGTLWIGTGSVYAGDPRDGGLNRLDKKTGRFTRYLHDPNDPLSLANNKVKAIFEDSKGNFWVGTSGDGLHTMDRARGTFTRHLYDPAHPEKLSRPPFKPKPYFDQITFIIEDITGAIWIGTSESGLNYYDPRTGRTKHYEYQKETEGAFTDRLTWSAYTSRDGVLWISTIDGNLYRVNPLRRDIAHQMPEEGVVLAFYEEENGTHWIGTQRGLLVQSGHDANNVKRYTHHPADPASLGNNFVSAIAKDNKGNMWIGTDGGLDLWDRKTDRFIHYRHNPKDSRSLSHNIVNKIYEDKNADLWIGTMKGLNRMSPKTGTFTRYIFHPEDTSTFGLNIISSVLEDKQGQLWANCGMAGDIHLLNRENGTFKTYLKGKGIVTLFVDSKGAYWAGGSEGLFRYDYQKGDFVPYLEPGTGSGFSYVRSIVEDGQNNIWLGTDGGILKLDNKGMLARRYSQPYGINGTMLVYGSGYKGRNGQLFFGSGRGYFTFFPERLPQNVMPPQIVFSGFRLIGRERTMDTASPLRQPLSLLNMIRLNHNQNAFSFDFAAIDFINPEENRHYFMLENYEQDWNHAGSDRRAIYFNVPPGKYVLHVKATNSSGVWAQKSMTIIIVPPWWSTWWFRVPAAILAIAVFYGLIRWRTQYKLKLQLERSQKERQLADLANKAMELEMKALRAQMNPHFIFNSLNSINRFILQNNKAQASEYLTKFSRLVRLTLQNSQAALISLESELEALQLYLELEALRFEQHFEFAIHLDKEIDAAMLMVPPLIIQPFAENAIWHGLMHKEDKGHLVIDIFQKEDALYYRITDDGIGRKKAAELKSLSANTHRSMGMQITADRITLLQQQKFIDASILITDLVLPDGKAGGTEVVLKLPVIYD